MKLSFNISMQQKDVFYFYKSYSINLKSIIKWSTASFIKLNLDNLQLIDDWMDNKKVHTLRDWGLFALSNIFPFQSEIILICPIYYVVYFWYSVILNSLISHAISRYQKAHINIHIAKVHWTRLVSSIYGHSGFKTTYKARECKYVCGCDNETFLFQVTCAKKVQLAKRLFTYTFYKHCYFL